MDEERVQHIAAALDGFTPPDQTPATDPARIAALEAQISDLRAELGAAQNLLTLRTVELRQADRRAAMLAAVRPVVEVVLSWEASSEWATWDVVAALQDAASALPADVRAWAEETDYA